MNLTPLSVLVTSVCLGAPLGSSSIDSGTTIFSQSVATQAAPRARRSEPGLARVWVSVGTDHPAFCLALAGNGTGRFSGGFLFYNPIRWTYSRESRELALTIPNLPPGDEHLITEGFLGPDTFFRYERRTKTIGIALLPDADRFYFFGFYLFRADGLDGEKYSAARARCPQLPQRQ